MGKHTLRTPEQAGKSHQPDASSDPDQTQRIEGLRQAIDSHLYDWPTTDPDGDA
ncbi:hypothetical protein GCM10010174_69730 [Kutzneria viridogrisea]|uniref:Uncharacterized protein n=1 Tax=Kutzneria viridogrisea TaxID=47990 RepID=A0ABR6BAY9_9PSEU|nr:hypothetical protein [Kutzneria viridogrisea]